ncbi:MAG TPA: hypothetical protein VEP69_03165 [Thermodesulfovibrionales bacterium]|nr:hypothetical protein [Thermodesulfovibrionales bacterium]
MRHRLIRSVFSGFMLLTLIIACATTKTIHVWKDDQYRQKLRKVLVIALAEQEFMRDHFENVLAENLQARGIEAVPSNKVLPLPGAKIDREAVVAKVRELGVENVLVARPVSKKEVSQLTPGGLYFVPTEFYDGWYGFYSDSFFAVSVGGSAYDAEFFNIVTNIYDVRSDKLIWSYFSRTKVEGPKQGAINPFIDVLLKQLRESGLL